VELGAAGFVSSSTSPPSPPPPGSTPTEIACPTEGLLALSQSHLHELSPTSKDLVCSEGRRHLQPYGFVSLSMWEMMYVLW